MLRRTLFTFLLSTSIFGAGRMLHEERAAETTEAARRLLLERIQAIRLAGECRMAFEGAKVDLELVETVVRRTRFYSADGLEGNLRFSEIVGRPSSPDRTIRELARQVAADAFVLGFFDGDAYVRTGHVVLNRGYFQQGSVADGTWRLTSPEEKQDLLLHELLHIALDKDDDELHELEVCPLGQLALCSRPPKVA